MVRDEVWVTKDGRRIAVSDMSEEHVKNILRMFIRKERERAISLMFTTYGRDQFDVKDRYPC